MKCTVHFSTPYKPFPNHKDGNSNFDLLGVPQVVGSSPTSLSDSPGKVA